MEIFKDNELVSIIMPVYNGALTIGESVESVLAQTYPRWELIIIDDCSTDDTKTVVACYQDERIRYWCQPQNLGVAKARNKGISMAQGRYIAFLDSDDLWLPEKLAEQLSFMRRNNYGFTYTEYRHFTDDHHNVGKIIKVQDCVSYKELLKGNDIGCLTVMLDRMQFGEIWMPNHKHEDYITWINLLSTGKKAYGFHRDLARYRKSSHSMTSNKFKSLKWTWNVYHNYKKLSYIESFEYMIYYAIGGIKKHFGI